MCLCVPVRSINNFIFYQHTLLTSDYANKDRSLLTYVFCVQVISQWLCTAKVNELGLIRVKINDNIVQLDVTMENSPWMAVLYGIHNLTEVGTRYFFIKPFVQKDLVKQFNNSTWLFHDKIEVNFVLKIIQRLNDILMIKFSMKRNFTWKYFEDILCKIGNPLYTYMYIGDANIRTLLTREYVIVNCYSEASLVSHRAVQWVRGAFL